MSTYDVRRFLTTFWLIVANANVCRVRRCAFTRRLSAGILDILNNSASTELYTIGFTRQSESGQPVVGSRRVPAVQRRATRPVCLRNVCQWQSGVKKAKVADTRLTSVGFPSWSRFLAISLQVMWVINPALGCHYFSPGPQLPPQPLRGLLPNLMLGEQGHSGCEHWTVCLRLLPDNIATAIWTRVLQRLSPAR